MSDQKRNQRNSSENSVSADIKAKKVYLLSKEAANDMVKSLGKIPPTIGDQILKVQDSFSKIISMPDLTSLNETNEKGASRKLWGIYVFICLRIYILVKFIIWSNLLFSQIYFLVKSIFSQIYFWSNLFFGQIYFLVKSISGQIYFLVKSIF